MRVNIEHFPFSGVFYTVTTLKYVEGRRDRDAPEVVGNTSSIRIFQCWLVLWNIFYFSICWE